MNTFVQSVWVKPPAPAGKPGRKTARTVQGEVNPDTLTICDDPLPAHRARPGCKYAATFGALKPGQAVKCQREDVNRIANALRKHIETHPDRLAEYLVRSIRDYGDGLGRVWLMPPAVTAKPAKPAGKPARVK